MVKEKKEITNLTRKRRKSKAEAKSHTAYLTRSYELLHDFCSYYAILCLDSL